MNWYDKEKQVIKLFKLLETFRVVYESKNFSQSAAILFMSQPAVSNQIKQLETDLGVILFLRNGRQGILPTPQADLLYKQTLLLLEDWQKTKRLVTASDLEKIDCRISSSHTFSHYLLPTLMKQLLLKFPNLNFTVQMKNSLEILQDIEKHQADLGFIEKPLSSPNIKRKTLMKDQLVVAGDPNEDLWLIREASSGVYHYSTRYFEEQNINGPFMEVQNNDLIIQFLKQGIGRSIISKRGADGLHVEYLPEMYHRHFYLMERTHLEAEPLQNVSQFIQEWAHQQEKS